VLYGFVIHTVTNIACKILMYSNYKIVYIGPEIVPCFTALPHVML